MIFESQQERDKLVAEITEAISATKPKKEKEKDPGDKDEVGGEIPLDKVLPPAAGHGVGERVPNTSAKNQPYDGGFVEAVNYDLETRLCKLLGEMINPDEDQSEDAQGSARRGQVGTVGVLGHSKGNKEPATAAAAYRQKVDPYAKRGQAEKEAKDKNKGPTEKLEDAIEKAADSETESPE